MIGAIVAATSAPLIARTLALLSRRPATIVGGRGLAFVFGAIAHRFRIPPLVGYSLAGIAVGPFTPGFVADQG
jgi:predicted Kef-type K+ transport protein